MTNMEYRLVDWCDFVGNHAERLADEVLRLSLLMFLWRLRNSNGCLFSVAILLVVGKNSWLVSMSKSNVFISQPEQR